MRKPQPSVEQRQPEQIPLWIGVVLEHQHQLERALVSWSRGAFHRDQSALS